MLVKVGGAILAVAIAVGGTWYFMNPSPSPGGKKGKSSAAAKAKKAKKAK
jgi:hypothetical protein